MTMIIPPMQQMNTDNDHASLTDETEGLCDNDHDSLKNLPNELDKLGDNDHGSLTNETDTLG